MLKGLGDLGQIMKLQKEFKNIQKKLQRSESQGESKDGSVKVMVNGEYCLTGLQIDESLLKSADKKKIESMIISAVNNAVEKVKEYAASEMGRLTGGLNIPGISNFLK
jgi:nucleoid-associated protein EbfC